jgi:penicillin-binding protein 1C
MQNGDRRLARRWLRRLLRASAVSALGFFVVAGWAYFGSLPDYVSSPNPPTNVLVLVDRSGRPIDPVSARVLRNASAVNPSLGARVPPLSLRAAKLAAATIAAEDERFAKHPGVDVVAIGRAGLADIRARSMVEGGSTITQQLVKLRMGRTGKSAGLAAKAKEAVYAVRLDRVLGKRDIMSAFLREAPYGGRIVGADDAARSYFETTVSQLSWAQAAYLAALPRRPTRFNPQRDPKAALGRQKWILGRLHDAGKITKREYESALREPVEVQLRAVAKSAAPHVVEMIRSNPTWQAGTTTSNGVRILETTLDLPLQEKVAGMARRRRTGLSKNAVSNVAVVVIDNRSGAIRAWEGSGGYADVENGGMINGPLQRRQTGSTIKPFIYGLAFDAGRSPGDMIDDAPFSRPGFSDDFRPENYDRRFHGVVSLRSSLAQSINVPAVKLLADSGPQELLNSLTRAGVTIEGGVARHGLSLALGTGEMSLLDLTRAYAAIARSGQSVTATLSQSVSESAVESGLMSAESDDDLTAFGDPVDSEGAVPNGQVMSPGAAFLVADVLSDNEARAPAFGRNSVLSFPFPVAAKTGTSQNFRDNWVVGFTADFTVGVWVGNFDRTSLRDATGVTGAGPLFHDVVLAAHDALTPASSRDRPASVVPKPDSILERCVGSCNGTRAEYVWGDQGSTGAPRNANVKPAKSSELALVEPRPKSRYLIDPSVESSEQQIRFSATGGSKPYRFTIRPLDRPGSSIIESRKWTLAVGRFQVCVTDSTSSKTCSDIVVR